MKRLALLLLCALLSGCGTLGYYSQAVHGQLSLLADAKPIEEWLGDPALDPKLRQRLEAARAIRQFAVQELALPDNKSYRNYAALTRPFVVWNVVAAPELSLRPMQWCFPVAGCVSYRGYYAKDSAQAYANELRAQGWDVQVAGVPAYSTLGWFNDPLLSTFINYPDAEMARLVFHELAHQVVYVSGDAQFNEGFASTVEEAGVQRWLALHGNAAMRSAYEQQTARRHDFVTLLAATRRRLADLYASKASDADKRIGKQAAFARLQTDYQSLKQSWGGYSGYDRWFAEPLSNAHLAAVATYTDYLPGLRALLARSANLPAFYEAARALTRLSKEERSKALR